MVQIDCEAPVRFLRTAFEPQDWVAIFLKSYDTGQVARRVGAVSWVVSARFQAWLSVMSSHKFNVYVSVNAIASGRHSRTRDAIATIRHVFLEVDEDANAVCARVEVRRDLPPPSYVLHSSLHRIHLFWRVSGFEPEYVENLQKRLARELGTDPAATPITQNTRLPGFLYLGYPLDSSHHNM
jgi:hypothetical protein